MCLWPFVPLGGIPTGHIHKGHTATIHSTRLVVSSNNSTGQLVGCYYRSSAAQSFSIHRMVPGPVALVPGRARDDEPDNTLPYTLPSLLHTYSTVPTYTQTTSHYLVIPYHTIPYHIPPTTRHDPTRFHSHTHTVYHSSLRHLFPTTTTTAPHCALPPTTRAPLRKSTTINNSHHHHHHHHRHQQLC